MGMIIENEFTVPAAADKVMAYLLDVEKVAKCLPGAQLTQIVDDKTYKGKMKIKMGAMDLTFAGTVTITELDNQTGRVVMKATGREEKGKGQADANIVAQITDQGNATVQKLPAAPMRHWTISVAWARTAAGITSASARAARP